MGIARKKLFQPKKRKKRKHLNLKDMINIRKSILFTIFIFSAFTSDNITNTNHTDMEMGKNLIQLINQSAKTEKEDEEFILLLLDSFGKEEQEQLIEYVIKEDEQKQTALHFASLNGHTKIVKFLLKAFMSEKEKNKLIEYVMKENDKNFTALHIASDNDHEEIVQLLLEIFHKEDKEKLIEYLMKETKNNETALHLAAKKGNVEIFTLLSETLTNATNPKFYFEIICDTFLFT